MLSGEVNDGDTAIVDVDDDGQVKVVRGKQQELLLQAIG
jgi:ATP-dependent Clp protease ATP-binding subunit ClpC